MKKLFGMITCAALMAGAASAQELKGWKLAWQEEFNYSGLPDTSKWGYEVGHIRNQEQQYYTPARRENIRVENGNLVIRGLKENYANAAYRPGSERWNEKDSLANYTSASINTQNKFAAKYGRIEVRAKLPAGGGIWPAIWMMGIDRSHGGWPHIGEIDIMEFIGKEPQNVYGTIHYAKDNGHASSGNKISSEELHKGYHIYAIEWDEEKIDIYFDSTRYHRFMLDVADGPNGNPFRKPFYLLLNLAMGANWPGPVDDSVLPQEFLVDYVRVYEAAK